MLLWEALTVQVHANGRDHTNGCGVKLQPVRLPFDKRCLQITRSGKRCRGRVRKDSEYCPLHDPAFAEARRRGNAKRAPGTRSRLAHLPDGYLRKLKTTAAVGNAMDRLYREIRLGIVTPEMGRILFTVLTRLMDSGLLDAGRLGPKNFQRTKAARFRPKLSDLLTRAERSAWRKAVANAPAEVVRANALKRPTPPSVESAPKNADERQRPVERPIKLTLQQAS